MIAKYRAVQVTGGIHGWTVEELIDGAWRGIGASVENFNSNDRSIGWYPSRPLLTKETAELFADGANRIVSHRPMGEHATADLELFVNNCDTALAIVRAEIERRRATGTVVVVMENEPGNRGRA